MKQQLNLSNDATYQENFIKTVFTKEQKNSTVYVDQLRNGQFAVCFDENFNFAFNTFPSAMFHLQIHGIISSEEYLFCPPSDVAILTDSQKTRKKALTLAKELYRHNKGILNWGECMKYGWDMAKKDKELKLVEFETVKGEIKTRVIKLNWAKYCPPKGNGRPAPKDSKLFLDVAKFESGKPSIISAKVDKINFII